MGLLATSYINTGLCVNTNMMTLCKNMFYPHYKQGFANGTLSYTNLCWAKKCGEGLMTWEDTNSNKILQNFDVQNVGTNYRYINGASFGNLFSFYYFLQHSIPGYDHYSLSNSEVRTALNNLGLSAEIDCGLLTKIQSPTWESMLPDWGTDIMADYGDGSDFPWDPYYVIDNDCNFGFFLDAVSIGSWQTELILDTWAQPIPEGWTDAGYRVYNLYVSYPECVKKVRINNNIGYGWQGTVEVDGYQYDGHSHYLFEWTASNTGDDNTSNMDIFRDCEVTAMYIDPPLRTNNYTFSGWVS